MLDLWCALLLTAFVVATILICFSDADLTLMYYDKFGGSLDKHLSGQVVWVTGASTGIGAALAIEAAKHKAKVVLSARSEEKLKEVQKQCIEASRGKEHDFLVLPLDMCDFSAHEEAVNKVKEHFGKISIVVHNAGRSQRARWEHIDLNVDKAVFDLNVFSLVNLTRLVMPTFHEQGGGSLAIMSSVAGKVGVPFSCSYTGSKHAIHGYFESLRTEKTGTGINVTMLCPGPTFSNLLEGAATEVKDQNFGGNMSATDRRMTAERCARLSLVATCHKLEEAWITFFPVLPMLYFSQYMPAVSKKLIKVFGTKAFQKMRDSQETVKNK